MQNISTILATGLLIVGLSVNGQSTTCGQSSVFIPPGNGTFPVQANDFPWLVRLSITGEPICTGSIISNQWILSAAKCFLTTSDSQTVFSGDIAVHVNDLTLSTQDHAELLVSVDRVFIHPQHEEISLRYNFALVHLDAPLIFSNSVKPICLIEDCIDENAPNSVCTISGWASDRVLFNETAKPNDYLQKSNLPLVDRRACQAALSLKPDLDEIEIGEDMTCAGYEDGYIDDCRGDAGGPLACRNAADNTFYLQGINSFGFGCLPPQGYYHIFARPCHVMSWIRNVTGYNQPSSPFPPWSTLPGNIVGPAPPSGNIGNKSANNYSRSETAGPLPNVITPISARKVTRLLLTSDEESLQCGQNKYGMMAAGKVAKPRPALILEFPWQVRIEIGSFDTITPFTCGASLIEDNWVLTSARCITEAQKEGRTTMTAHIGEYDLTRPTSYERSVPVVKDFIHPSYDKTNYDYDFALLTLSERVRFSDVARPICLLADCDVKPEDDNPTDCLTIGWRTIANRKSDPAKSPLEVAAVNVTTDGACKSGLGDDDYSERKLCVVSAFGSTAGRPSCQVDNGGPLLCKMATEDAYFLHGIASYTQRGCTYNNNNNNNTNFVVYSRPCQVGRWIQETVRGYNDNSSSSNNRQQ